MSKEYRQRFTEKIAAEANAFLLAGGVVGGPQGLHSFIKRRAKHYGITNKYLPPDFKRDMNIESTNASGTEGTAESAA